jgi:predicted helicase
VVHFYETFLKAYDPKMREARGVYYTPEPVVSYIVRSVDHILKTEFGLPDGLADNSMIEVPVPSKPKETRMVHRVQILDPACGTGTFLAQVIETIRDTVVAKHGAGMWPGYVHDHLLPRLYGFELLMAPYAIAHLKLGLRLKETGYDIEQSERLRVYLTNSLEEAHEREHGQLTFFGTWLAEEADRASEVKRELPIMVILGNPPYSASSQNKGEWITGLLKDYKAGLHERKINLDDDFIKFFRFGQWRIERTGHGILGLISNNAFLTGITHRRMRESLLSTFDQASVLDLHGDMRQHDVADDGSNDDNVFDITQGVAITLLVKRPSAKLTEVRSAHLTGRRQAKYDFLSSHSSASTEWQTDSAEAPHFFFAREAEGQCDDYLSWPSVTEIFGLYSSGIQTKRDRLCVQFSRDDMRQTILAFSSLTPEEARIRFHLPADGRDWTVLAAQADIVEHNCSDDHIAPLLYRPFDLRYTYWTGRTKGFLAYPRREVMQHMVGGSNVALMFNRQIAGTSISQFGVTSVPACHGTFYLGNRGQDYVAPAFLRSSQAQATIAADSTASTNFSQTILDDLANRLGLSIDESHTGGPATSFGSRDVLDYIYAVMNSPAYRLRYSGHLRIDFPRIPLTSDRELFRELCRLGARLVALHLLEADDLAPVTTYPVPGDNRVEKVRYTEPGQGAEQGRIWISATQYFEGVPPAVWAFHVGGYQVCAKWLKDRKARQLSYADLTHYQYVVAALAETIVLMREIDEVIEAHGGWPLK